MAAICYIVDEKGAAYVNFTMKKEAAKTLAEMDFQTQKRIAQAILKIPAGDIKPLQGYSSGYYRLRVGKWRIIFTYADSTTVLIAKIAPRGDVYKGVI